MNLMSVLEINSHPNDLYIFIAKGKKTDKLGFMITRGPGHDFKPILSSKPAFKTRDDTITAIKEVLEFCPKKAKAELKNPRSFLAKILIPRGATYEECLYLTQDMIDWILEELKQGKTANTWERPEPEVAPTPEPETAPSPAT